MREYQEKYLKNLSRVFELNSLPAVLPPAEEYLAGLPRRAEELRELSEENTAMLRRELFLRQKEAVEAEISRLEKTLDMILYKCWYYGQAIKDGNEDRISEMLPDKMPEEIQALYDHAHEE